MTFDADDASVVDNDVVDGEFLSDLGAGFGGAVDEHLVEHGSARAVGDRRVLGTRCARDRERAEVEGVRVDGWTAGRHQLVQQAPPLQCRNARRVEDVRGKRVARKCGPIHDENLITLAREQHRRR